SSRRRHTRFHVTGVQTCALPIYNYQKKTAPSWKMRSGNWNILETKKTMTMKIQWSKTKYILPLIILPFLFLLNYGYQSLSSKEKIGRASCRERVKIAAVEAPITR